MVCTLLVFLWPVGAVFGRAHVPCSGLAAPAAEITIKRSAFLSLRCENRPPEYDSYRPSVGAGRLSLGVQTVWEEITMRERRFFALQTGREDWGCCGCRFSQHRLNKRGAFWFLMWRQVPQIPSRVHEADAVTPILVAAPCKSNSSDRYKINSTPRNEYAGLPLKHIKKAIKSPPKRVVI